MDRVRLQQWVDAYLDAWRSRDREAVEALFTPDARYHHGPFGPVDEGCDAVVAEWVAENDSPGAWQAEWRALAADGDLGVAEGRTRYLAHDGSVRMEFANLVVVRFDDTGRCREYKEWAIRAAVPSR